MNKRVAQKLGVGILALGLAVSASIFGLQQALAATGSIYITPATNSVQAGNSVTVNVRISPGTTVDSVQGTVGFDASKLQLVSVNTAGSAFSTELQNTTSSGSVVFARGDFGAGASTDSLIESITFKALASSGSASLTLTGANADASGSFTNPSSVGTGVSFTAAPVVTPTCPSGQTGTPPNCVAPVSGGSTGGTSSGGSKTTTPTTTTKTPPSSTTTTPTAAPTGASTPTATSPAPTVTAQKVLYTQAELSFTSKTPTKVYVRFGLDGLLTTNTPETDFATTHTVTIDPSLLVPGESYSYVVVATDQQGNIVQSTVQHFATKGLTLTMGVFDTNHNPLRGKTVTLHSIPETAKTDKNGFVTFTNVAPGDHQVLYTAGKKTYTQQVTVVNNVQTSGSTQTAPAQNFSVVYGFTQSDLHIPVWIWILLAIAILGLLGKTGRLGFAFRLNNPKNPQLYNSQSVVVGATTSSTRPSVMSATPNLARVEERLKAIQSPAAPQPGATIAPQTPAVAPMPNTDTANDGQGGVNSGRL